MSIKNFVIKSRAYLTAVRNLREGVLKQNSWKTVVNIENTDKKISPKNCYSIYSSKNLLLRT